jgi:hypothetical protein
MAGSAKQRLMVRAFNAAKGLGARFGSVPGLVDSADALHETAATAVGYDDFGDPSYRQGFDVLMRAYDEEARLTPFGRMMVDQQLLGILKNRLFAERAWAADPGIRATEINRPIFVLGLPRTGTTALHHLLGQDPGIQILEYWLAAAPQARPAVSGWAGHADFKRSARDLKTTYYLDPSLKAIHLMTAEGPEECRHLFQQTFSDDTFDCNATIPSYSEWYFDHDMTDCYERHRDLLKLIGSTSPEKRWVLKYPVHMRNLRTLLKIYPDACFVQTHRDPAKIMPSVCSLVAGWRALYESDVDVREIGQWQLELWAKSLEHTMEVRSEMDPSRFFDLPFKKIVSDPLAAIRDMYAHFEMDLSEEGTQAVSAWHTSNPRGKFGEHIYRADDFGFTNESLHARFGAYMGHFGVKAEAV